MRYAKSSVTSVSRQNLLSGKFPFQLEDPWYQAKEKKKSVNCAENLGFKESQIEYKRGYDVDFDLFTKCGAVIIMDIAENVHGQKQGHMGMFNDVSLMEKQHKLADLTKKLLKLND